MDGSSNSFEENLKSRVETYRDVFNKFLSEQDFYTSDMEYVLDNTKCLLETVLDKTMKSLRNVSFDDNKISEICIKLMKPLYDSFWNFLRKSFNESVEEEIFDKITKYCPRFENEISMVSSEHIRLISQFPSEYTPDNHDTFKQIFNDLKTLMKNTNKLWEDIEDMVVSEKELSFLSQDVLIKVYDNKDNLLYENKYNPESLASDVRKDINSHLELSENKEFLISKAVSFRKDTKVSIMCAIPSPPKLKYLASSTSTATLKEFILKINNKFGDKELDNYFGLTPLDYIKIVV